tara:strand:+ start:13982 stop:15496 length:1515 start_codon:yes stop_codon:yes gene_type:complete
MPDIKIEKVDESFVRILTEDFGILQEVQEEFSFLVPGHQWMPKFKCGMWDGKLRLLNMRNRTLPSGLLYKLLDFCKNRKYSIEVDDALVDVDIATPEQKHLLSYFDTLNISDSKGKRIQPHDYQIEGVCHALENYKSILKSPTASGKSLMIYLMSRYFMEQVSGTQQILVIVPTVSLVSQMYGDFHDYSLNDSTFNVTEQSVHTIQGGRSKDSNAPIVISTWQSIFKQPKSWFAKFGMVVGDEAHQYKAQSLSKIMEHLGNAWIRVGTTGTIPDDAPVNKLVLEGHFGPVYNVITTKKLMDRGNIAQLNIHSLVLKYSADERKAFGGMPYKDEIDYIVSNKARNRFIRKLALSLKGNTLVLFNYVQKHGIPLHADITKHAKDGRKVFFVSGGTAADDREACRRIVEGETDAIINASLGVFSTGVNIKNIHNIIFAAPTKSQIRVLQSIGRGLRKSDNGKATTLYDIVDDLSYGKRKNYALKHGIERSKIYLKEKFSTKSVIIDI